MRSSSAPLGRAADYLAGPTRKLLLLFHFLLVACTQSSGIALQSPSGEFIVRTEVPGDAAGPTLQLCAKLLVHEVTSGKDLVFQTGTSTTQKWAVVWSPANVLVLYSSDIGTNAYEIKDGKIIERPATHDENEIGREAYKVKYGKLPRAKPV